MDEHGTVSPREPWFLSTGLAAGSRTLFLDFVTFLLTLAYYPACLTVGVAALLADRLSGGRWFARFVELAERIDNGAP